MGIISTMPMNQANRQSADELRAQILERLNAYDKPGAVQVATDAVREGRISIDDLYTQVLSPLLAQTGADWQAGRLRVWQEHWATAVVRTIVESLYLEMAKHAASVPPNGKTVLLTTPSEESHDLGVRMLADRMALAGWRVFFLGADSPELQIAEAAQALGADLVLLSIATHFNRVRLRRQLDELHRLLPNVRIVVGGPAFVHDADWRQDETITLAELGLAQPPSDAPPGSPAESPEGA